MIKIKNNAIIELLNAEYYESIKQFLEPAKLHEFLAFSSRFDTLNFTNCLLLFNSNREVSQVATFSSWSKLGCHIKRGSHGYKVIISNDVISVFDKEQIIGDIPQKRGLSCGTYKPFDLVDKIFETKFSDKYAKDGEMSQTCLSGLMMASMRISYRLNRSVGNANLTFENVDELYKALILAFNFSKETFNEMHNIYKENNYEYNQKKLRNPTRDIRSNSEYKGTSNSGAVSRIRNARSYKRTNYRLITRKIFLRVDKLSETQQARLLPRTNANTSSINQDGQRDARTSRNSDRKIRSTNREITIPTTASDERHIRESSSKTINNESSKGISSEHLNLQQIKSIADGNILPSAFSSQETVSEEQFNLFSDNSSEEFLQKEKDIQTYVSSATLEKSQKLADLLVGFFNSLDTKYKGSFYNTPVEIKKWDKKYKNNTLSIFIYSPVADMKSNAFTYFNRDDKTDELTMNDAIFNNKFLSQFKDDEDFSISFSPTTVFVFCHNIDDKNIDFSLAENLSDIPIQNKPPFWERYTNIKEQHTNDIVLNHFGEFYEAYNEDATKLNEIFDFFIFSRNITNVGGIKTAGFPDNQLDSNIKLLQEKGFNITIVPKNTNKPILSYPSAEVLKNNFFEIQNTNLEKTNLWNRVPEVEETQNTNLPVKTILYSDFASEFVKSSSDFIDCEMNLYTNDNGKEFVLGYGNLGNGTAVWNYFNMVDGDYEIVAHIDEDSAVKLYDETLPLLAVKEIEDKAEQFYPQKEIIDKIIAINSTYKFNALKTEIEARDVKADFAINYSFRGYTRKQLNLALEELDKSNLWNRVPEVEETQKSNLPTLGREVEEPDKINLWNRVPEVDTSLITENSDEISIDGHIGTWYVVESSTYNNIEYFLLEHEEYGDETSGLIVTADKSFVLDDVWNGFLDLEEYFDGDFPIPKEQVSQVPDDVINQILTAGSHYYKKDLDVPYIVGFFMYNTNVSDRARFLAEHYREGGNGFIFNGEKYALWYDENGMQIARGATALNAVSDKISLSWLEVASKIESLLNKGLFAKDTDIKIAQDVFLQTFADEFSLMYRSKSDAFSNEFLDNLTKRHNVASFDLHGTAKNVITALKNIDTAKMFVDSLKLLNNAHLNTVGGICDKNSTLSPARMLFFAKSFINEPSVFSANSNLVKPTSAFITNDEIEKSVFGRKKVSTARKRIYDFFVNNSGSSFNERANFLKSEYGIGGYNAYGVSVFSDAKGITVKRSYDAEKKDTAILTWSQVEKKISNMIENDEYLSDEEYEKLFEADNSPKIKSLNETNVPAENSYTIYQLNSKVDYRFESLKYINDNNIKINKDDYSKIYTNLVFTNETSTIENILGKIYERFNFNLPPEFKGHSLSMSDVIELNIDGKQSFHYVDRIGFKEIPFEISPKMILDISESPETQNNNLWNRVPEVEENQNDNLSTLGREVEEPDKTNLWTSGPEVSDEVLDDKIGQKTFSNERNFPYKVNDVIILEDNISYKITELSERYVELLDENLSYPVFRSERKSDVLKILDMQNLSVGYVQKNYSSTQDYVFNQDNVVLGTKKERIKNNIEAIKLISELDIEKRTATQAEQDVLAKYIGFGGLAEAFDSDNATFKDEFNEILEIVSPDDYRSLKSTVLSAHYTPKEVIDFMYQALNKIGFKGGNILDPSTGTGNFISAMPKDMKSNSNVTGVELDKITGKISKHLYPNSNILINGFEDCKFKDNSFDVAISNIPFGDFKISNENHNALIHDFFFLNAIDKVRSGGIIAFVTSKGTMDKSNYAIREKIAKQADLLFAVRLPNNAFKKLADTQVTTDIIFLQKREEINLEPEENWLYSLPYELDGEQNSINQYFVDNPQFILGDLTNTSLQYGRRDIVVRPNNLSLKENLDNALKYVKGNYEPAAKNLQEPNKELVKELKIANDNIKNYTYFAYDNAIYYKENDILKLNETATKSFEKYKLFLDVKSSLRNLMDSQLNGTYDPSLHIPLNTAYDNFVKKYGYLSLTKNSRVLNDDIEFALVASIENQTKDKIYEKGDIFYRQTIKEKRIITYAENAVDALMLSLSEKGKVDIEYINSLYKSENVIDELKDLMYIDPESLSKEEISYIYKDEYLSGYVKEKLFIAKSLVDKFPVLADNISALEQCQPIPIDASDISVRLSAQWIDVKYVNQFLKEHFALPRYADIRADYSKLENIWKISNKKQCYSIENRNVYGTNRMYGLEIVENSLNQKKVVIKDRVEDDDGKIKYVYNHNESQKARNKQNIIEEKFKEWIFNDVDRRNDLENTYNSLFNSYVKPTYDGSHLALDYHTDTIKLRPHQLNAIARVATGNNTLLAHVVGAGKTYTMAAGGMEQLRLGTATKLMYVVPNHLTEQFGADFLKLIPTANILVAKKKDFEPANRKRFISKIATSNIDAVILGHSQFEKINISIERRENEIRKEIDALEHAIMSLSEKDERQTVKRLESKKKNLETKLKDIFSEKTKDKMITFEELGVDSLFVDEAHYFKNGAIFSKMQNVAGVSSSHSNKASDMLAKCRYINEINGSITFATGTPISNTMSEVYVLQRYLQEQTLNKAGIYHFDEWASVFGETELSVELKPEGSGFQTKTRFANFFNLPELKTMFAEVADIQNADMLNLPTPDLYGGKPQIIVSKPSVELKRFMQHSVERADDIRSGLVKPWEDNMLKLTSDARKCGTDMRLYDSNADCNENSKIFKCAERIMEHYNNSDGTQLVFCDIGTPSKDKFNVYDELKRVLIEKGAKECDIAFIHDANSETKKEQLFSDMRKGTKRILVGSTQKCGAGTNVQDKLIALHHIDCPWRPSDIEQREGRILRQGNENKEVYIYRYVTEESFDAYMWQILENKQKFITKFMSVDNMERTCGDIDDLALQFADVKVVATGNPLFKEKADIENKLNNLIFLESQFKKDLYSNQDLLHKMLPKQLESYYKIFDKVSKDLLVKKEENFSIILNGIAYDERAKAAEALQLIMSKHFLGVGNIKIGSFNGFDLTYLYDNINFNSKFILCGDYKYETSSGSSALGNITRIENIMDSIPITENYFKEKIEETKHKITTLTELIKTTIFPQKNEIEVLKTRLSEITVEIETELDTKKNTQNEIEY